MSYKNEESKDRTHSRSRASGVLTAAMTVIGGFSGVVGAFVGYGAMKDAQSAAKDIAKIRSNSDAVRDLGVEVRDLQVKQLESELQTLGHQLKSLDVLRSHLTPMQRTSNGIDEMRKQLDSLLKLKDEELRRLAGDSGGNRQSRRPIALSSKATDFKPKWKPFGINDVDTKSSDYAKEFFHRNFALPVE